MSWLPEKVEIDPCTAATTPLEAFFGKQSLSTATGFFWRTGDAVHLVTNWHVVTGRHPSTGVHLSSKAGEPDRLDIDIFKGRNLDARTTVPLALQDEHGVPLWREHKHWRSSTDVVCVPLGELAADVFAMNDVAHFQGVRRVGMDVFVLGYPRGIGPSRYAIWKRASIASEPDVQVEGFPLTYVDTATAPGMSGAPVIQRFRGQGLKEGAGLVMGVDGVRLLGVYSGRMPGQDESEVSLGRVWKAPLIDEIIAEGIDGSREPRGVAPAFDFGFAMNFEMPAWLTNRQF